MAAAWRGAVFRQGSVAGLQPREEPAYSRLGCLSRGIDAPGLMHRQRTWRRQTQAFVNPNVTVNLSLPVLRHEDLSFPRTRESRRGGVRGRTRMDSRFRGHDESRDSLSAQPMTLRKGAGNVGMPALARPRRLFVLRRFVSSGLIWELDLLADELRRSARVVRGGRTGG